MAMQGVKFRAYPTREQAKALSRWIGCARVIYNCKVKEDKQNRKAFVLNGEKIKPNQAYSHFKTGENEWIKDCPAVILRNSCNNWYTAKERYFKKLAGQPTEHKKGQRDSILLTSEIFDLTDHVDENGVIKKRLLIGGKKFNIGELKFIDNQSYGNPKQIVISRKAYKWYVSFCYDNGIEQKSEENLLKEFSTFDDAYLSQITMGIDRGVAIPFQCNDGTSFGFSDRSKVVIKKKEARLKRYQRMLSRQVKTSKRRKKTRLKISLLHNSIYNIRNDFCHKTSHALVNSDAKIFAIEDLKLSKMTRRPKPKKDANGKFLPNKAKAKSGLNKGLLSYGLAKTVDFLKYKALKNNKIVIKVKPHYSSQECANCGHICADNRQTQANFVCLSCGNHDNADLNAAKVIKKRGVLEILSKPKAKTKTRLGTSRSKAKRGGSKTGVEEILNSQLPVTLEARPL